MTSIPAFSPPSTETDDPAPRERNGRPAVVIFQLNEALGDFVVHLAAYRAIRLAFPDHWVIGTFDRGTTATGAFARLRPFVYDQIAGDQPIGSGPWALRRMLRGFAPVDVVIDFRSNMHSAWSFLASLGLASRFAAVHGARNGGGLQFERRPTTNARRAHRLVERVAGRTLPYDTSLPEVPAAADIAARLLPDGPRYLGIVPGPSASFKAWPFDRHADVMRRAVILGLQPVLFLGPAEAADMAAYRREAPQALVIGPEAVGGDLGQLPWVIHAAAARLTACIAVDTGLGHLIATRHTPLITLAGPLNSERWRPVTPNWWLVDARDFGSREMTAIPVDAVTAALEEVLRWTKLPGRAVSQTPRRL